MSQDAEKSWSAFWKQAEKSRAGCLPGAGTRLGGVIDGIWAEAARALPPKAAVLDLATGDAAVLLKLKAARSDLRLTGIDSAASLPKPPPGISCRPATRMEALPFEAGSFDLVTSQFGYEYGETGRIAGEVARVLRPGGGLLFISHYRAGPIVRHNEERRTALAWAALESGWLAKARTFAVARSQIPLPVPPAFQQAASEAQRRFPTQSVATEFIQAILMTLRAGEHRAAGEVCATLDSLQQKAREELQRLDALSAAALDEDQIRLIVSELAGAGLTIEEPELLREPETDRPFAWLLRGRS